MNQTSGRVNEWAERADLVPLGLCVACDGCDTRVLLLERYSRSYFSPFMYMTSHAGTGLLHNGCHPTQSKIVII